MEKTLLNNYELAVLQKGAEVERTLGISIHAFPKYETNELLADYYAWALEGTKVDYKIVVGALRSCYDFWAVYFAIGEEEARAIHKAYTDEIIKEVEQRCEEHRKKREEEMEVLVNAN